jgi:hypothetical protein
VLAGAKSFAGMARSCEKNPNFRASHGTATWPRPPPAGLLYIFPGAGTLRKNASAN